MDYTKMTEQLIKKNSLKYRGLNVKAPEFFPEVRQHILKSNFIKEYVGSDEEFFDKLEAEFVQNNTWLFE